jgi:hypothetical protein
MHIVGLESLPNKEENQINTKYLAPDKRNGISEEQTTFQ